VGVNGTGSTLSFPFQLAGVWPAGDHLFPAFTVWDGGDSITSYGSMKVLGAPMPPGPDVGGESILPVGPLALLALVAGAALVAVRGRRKL
jgi:hypothetical protein